MMRRRAAAAPTLAALAAAALALSSCSGGDYDPLAAATASVGKTRNLEAGVPPACYTKTGGDSNPCWVCHTVGVGPNTLADFELQREYSFSEVALENHWTNLFVDRSAAIAAASDEEILDYIRQDNYGPLKEALAGRRGYPGYAPDLDLAGGFDDAGFARDGSGWRALRYKPFPGSFWPTNGSADDVFIRLPAAFRSDDGGRPSEAIYRINLAILEASIAARPGDPDDRLDREVEPVSEIAAGVDLDRDGTIAPAVTRVRGLPDHYVGGARAVKVRRYLYPEGTELLHSVRYVDPDSPTLLARRMKELRYARKAESLDGWAIQRAYEKEADEKAEGHTPVYRGSPLVGLRNAFGWQLQGFIEDERGRLRLQTEEEHRFCMGCHSSLGVTVDHTFTLARKVPGAAGWRHQDLRGIQDVPQAGHADPEILTYLRRVSGGDEHRGNREMKDRFFAGGALDEAEVRRASRGGDRDIVHLVAPSRARALVLAKAYRDLVRKQRFDQGRDTLERPAENVHRSVRNGATELGAAQKLFHDGRLHLDW